MNSISSLLAVASTGSQIVYWVIGGIALIVAVAVASFVWLDARLTRHRHERAESLTRDLQKRLAERQGADGAEQEEVEVLRKNIRDELESGRETRRLPPPAAS
jgi:hypothetical protein